MNRKIRNNIIVLAHPGHSKKNFSGFISKRTPQLYAVLPFRYQNHIKGNLLSKDSNHNQTKEAPLLKKHIL